MSIKISEVETFIVKLSEEFDIDIEEIRKVSSNVFKINPYFNKAAEDFAKEHKIDPSRIKHSSKSGKITITCMKKHLGMATRGSDAFTAAARKMAREQNLTEDDFPETERSGKVRKTTGVREITIRDVRHHLGIESPTKLKISPKARELIEKMNIDATKIKGTGKDDRIKISDVEEFLKNGIDSEAEESESESESEN